MKYHKKISLKHPESQEITQNVLKSRQTIRNRTILHGVTQSPTKSQEDNSIIKAYLILLNNRPYRYRSKHLDADAVVSTYKN